MPSARRSEPEHPGRRRPSRGEVVRSDRAPASGLKMIDATAPAPAIQASAVSLWWGRRKLREAQQRVLDRRKNAQHDRAKGGWNTRADVAAADGTVGLGRAPTGGPTRCSCVSLAGSPVEPGVRRLRDTPLRRVVGIHEGEPRAVALRPPEVVEERPDEEAADVVTPSIASPTAAMCVQVVDAAGSSTDASPTSSSGNATPFSVTIIGGSFSPYDP